MWILEITIFPRRNEQWNFPFLIIWEAEIFLMNWTWISHFTKGNKNTNHTNAHSRTRGQNCYKLSKRWIITGPKQTLRNTNGPQPQTHVRTNWQKCPNSTPRPTEKVAGSTPVDLLDLGAHQLLQRHLLVPPRKVYLGHQYQAGEKQGGSPNEWF